MPYINFNGNIYSEHEALLPVTNRGVRYGDGFFESMVMFDKKSHCSNFIGAGIEFTAQVLSAVLFRRAFLSKPWSGMMLDLASVNDAARNARIRLQLYRKGKGLYLPDEDELGYFISMDVLENSSFEAGSGLKTGSRDDCYKCVSMVSTI